MTYGTLGFGFFRDNARFRQKVLYWHIMPACSELGFRCEGKSTAESLESFSEGIRIQSQMAFASAAAQLARDRLM
ncbi:hypothetical protein [Methanoregula boonei]|jgi:hypothetical protein|uniref:hypothetical protein n=1 Tax=Methanoregula boonei TaxID=358766 RepID=UPI00064F8108|nr:hypothetical protein [Methanoregula boonei]